MNRPSLLIPILAFIASSINAPAIVASSPAQTQQRDWAYVLDNNLNTVTFRFTHADSLGGITGTDNHGLPVAFPLNDILGLWIEKDSIFPEELDSATHDQAMLIELTDGQRLSVVIESSADPDAVTGTRIDANLSVRIPLDRIRTISKARNSRNHSPSRGLFDQSIQDDALRLNNDDLVVGFINHIGTSVQIETTSASGQSNTQSYPLTQVHSIRIQNPPVHTPGTYILTTLRERLRVSGFSFNDDHQLTATLDDPIHSDSGTQLFLAELVAVDQIHDNQHLIDLASSTHATTTPTGNRSWAPPPKLSTNRWLGAPRTLGNIPSPVLMSWPLPDGARRFVMSINAWSRQWTDNRVSIIATDASGISHTLWTRHYDSTDSPRETIAMDLPSNPTHLQIHIDPANNGPIQDQLFVDFPLILVDGLPELE